MSPNITLITPTYNKHEYIPQTANSVLNQTRKDWEWWIILDYPTKETRKAVKLIAQQSPRIIVKEDTTPGTILYRDRFKHPLTLQPIYRPAMIINKYYPLVETKYLMWLSDDDILEVDALEQLAGTLDANPHWDIVHGNCEHLDENPDGTFTLANITGAHDQGLGTGINPHCNIDGGQFMQTRNSHWALGGWQIEINGVEDAAHCDGLYMEKLAWHYTFHYIGRRVLTHRRTKKSTFIKPHWAHQWIQDKFDRGEDIV